MIDSTLASNNSSSFRENVLERIQKLIMAIDDKILIEILQYDINREGAKIPALLSGKIDKYESFTGKEKLASDLVKCMNKLNLLIHL